MKTTIKKIAKAMLAGLRLAYRKKLQRSKREALYELLDDMAVALTKEGVDEGNCIFADYAGVLGALAEEIDIPLDPREWKHHRRNRK